MSTRTTNYNLIIGEGSDVVNPLTQIFPNFTSLDDILRNIADSGITTATELVTGTVHALTRTDTHVSVFRFQATSNYTSGETFTVDGVQVTALDVSGEALRTGAYIVGSMVLCELRDTLLTVYTSGGTDARTLEGHPASYFATNSALNTVDDKADANKLLIDGLTLDLNQVSLQLTTMMGKFVAQGNGVSFGADADGLYIQWRLSTTNIFKLSINTSTKYLSLANNDGSTWTTVWSGTLN